MSNLLKAEFYKLFHSWYFWGIGLFNLLLSSVLLLDSVGETSNLFFASIYNMPILYFLTIIFSALFVGNDFGRRTLQSYINAGHRRGKILFAKLVVHQIACMAIFFDFLGSSSRRYFTVFGIVRIILCIECFKCAFLKWCRYCP